MKNKEFNKKLIRLVLPITLQNFLFALVPVADAMMLVRLEQDAMSAVSLATQVNFVLNLFVFAVTMGVSMLVAQYWGKGDKDSIEQVWGFSQVILLPVGLLFFLAAFLFPEMVMRIFTSEAAIIQFGAKYLRIVSVSYMLTCVLQVIQVIMKNTGLVKQVTAISCFMVFANIIMNAIFIYGYFGVPAMGVEGAALATTISSFLSLVITIIIQAHHHVVHFRIRYILRIDANIRQDFIKYTGPVFGNQITWGIGFTTLTVIMGHLGSDAVAANSIVAVVKDLISCFCFALSSGGSIMVGNELGADRMDQAKEYGSRLCKLALYSGILSGLIIFASTPIVLQVVNLSDQAAFYLKWMLVMCVYYMVGRSMNSTVIAGIFCAGGDTKFGFLCDTVTMWGVIIPIGALAAFILKAPVLVVFFILNLDELIKLPVVYRHYKKYLWLRNLTRERKA